MRDNNVRGTEYQFQITIDFYCNKCSTTMREIKGVINDLYLKWKYSRKEREKKRYGKREEDRDIKLPSVQGDYPNL